MSSDVQGSQNSLRSSFRDGTAYLYLTEQADYQTAIADGQLSHDEMLSMNLVYQGTQYNVGELLDRYGGNVQLNVFRDDLIGTAATPETSTLAVADMSSYGATATTTTGITQEELCDMLLEDMLMDEIKEQLRETAAQATGDFSYDQDDSE